jgi:HK97 family phage prohead protease
MLRRAFSPDMEIRSGGDGRTVCGIAVPYNQRTPIREFGLSFDEEFIRGSFARTIAERGDRVKFLEQHDSTKPLGRATELREDAAGLYAEFRVSKTQRGDEFLELFRDGAMDSLSIGFLPVLDDQRNGGKHIIRKEVKLREVSAVTFPAYEGAVLSGLRSLQDDEVQRAAEAFEQIRAGAPLNQAAMASLKHVLSLVSAADTAVDEAQPILAKLLGVANPDIAQDAAMHQGDGDRSESPAGMALDLAIRKARLAGIRR